MMADAQMTGNNGGGQYSKDSDWVEVSLHSGQRDSRDNLTARVATAMRHPAVRCLSHPTGRLINHRAPNALDLGRMIEVALETGVALEINGLPNRLDLKGDHAHLAVQAGVPLVASTDAHSTAASVICDSPSLTVRRG